MHDTMICTETQNHKRACNDTLYLNKHFCTWKWQANPVFCQFRWLIVTLPARMIDPTCSGRRLSLMVDMVAATNGVGMTMRRISACATTASMSFDARRASGTL